MNWIVWAACGGGVLTVVAVVVNQLAIDRMERELAAVIERLDVTEVGSILTRERLQTLAEVVRDDAMGAVFADLRVAEVVRDDADKPECGWNPVSATLDCDWDRNCPTHGEASSTDE